MIPGSVEGRKRRNMPERSEEWDDGDGSGGWLVGWRINGGEIGGGKTKAALMMPLHLRAILIRGCAWRGKRGKRIQRHSWGNISYDSLAAPVQHSLSLSQRKQTVMPSR